VANEVHSTLDKNSSPKQGSKELLANGIRSLVVSFCACACVGFAINASINRPAAHASVATTTTTLTRFGMTNMLIPPVELADESLEHLAKILRQQAPWEDESLFDRSAQKDSGVRKKEHL
jgi:hypothetical protein